MVENTFSEFISPGVSFRGMPFWSWNGKLEPLKIRQQIRLMKEMGFGGFFMHSRAGLDTVYFSEEYFDAVSAAIDEAEKLGMVPWLYDEDRWPSGFAGGKVTQNDLFKMRALHLEKADSMEELSWNGNTVALFSACMNENETDIVSFQHITDKNFSGTEKILRFFWKYHDPSTKFNNQTYVDTLNPDAIAEFIRITHEEFKRRYQDKFGKLIPGIFTDEPCCFFSSLETVPWTEKLLSAFYEKWGYDLTQHLPELFYPCGRDVSQTRWHFREIVTSLFIDSFARQIGSWCENNNLKLTGHIQGEDYLAVQTVYAGSAMRFYEHMQLPGVDLLTEHRNSFVAVKQCVSAARQTGRKQRLSELYACTGWDFPLAGHKAAGDWQYALGINFRCHHLAFYTLKGEAKRDYPASIFYQSPWYKIYKYIEDYFSRLGCMLTDGDEICELLVIHPVESMWSMCNCRTLVDNGTWYDYDKSFLALSQELLAQHLDYDFGDEEQLSRFAAVENGILKVGCASYKAVLIPPVKTLRQSTLELLAQFADNGGKVCYYGDVPQYINAVFSEEVPRVFSKFTSVCKNDFSEKLAEVRRVSLTLPSGDEANTLLYRLNKNNETYTLFICNFGKKFAENIFAEKAVAERTESVPLVKIELFIPNSGNIYEFDAEDGHIYQVTTEYSDGKYIFESSFAALGSRLFVISEIEPEDVLPVRQKIELQHFSALPEDGWDYVLHEPNVLILDHAVCCVDGKILNENYFLEIDDALRKKLGCDCRGVAMPQPWLNCKTPEKFTNIELNFEFECEVVPQNECFLAVENPEEFIFFLNGIKLAIADDKWWIDPEIRLLHIPSNCIRIGKNKIVQQGKYHTKLSGLEALFIIGEFGVANERMTALPEKLSCKNVCIQQLPHYSGNLTYRKNLENIPQGRVYLSIPDWKGTALSIKINDSEEKLFICDPIHIDINSLVKRNGQDVLEITVYGHRRNMFGPFYLKNKPVWTGPRQFRMKETEQKQLVPFGLTGPVFICN